MTKLKDDVELLETIRACQRYCEVSAKGLSWDRLISFMTARAEELEYVADRLEQMRNFANAISERDE